MTLALDTSLNDLCISLFDSHSKELASFFHSPSPQMRGVHDAMLAAKTAELLTKVDAKAKDVNRIVLIAGPGSFTGLRIGLSFAKGIAYASGASLIPVPTHVGLQCSFRHKHEEKPDLLFAYPGYDKHSLYIAHAAAINDVALVPLRDLLPDLTIVGPRSALDLLGAKRENMIDCSISLKAIAGQAASMPEVRGFDAIAALEPQYITPFVPRIV